MVSFMVNGRLEISREAGYIFARSGYHNCDPVAFMGRECAMSPKRVGVYTETKDKIRQTKMVLFCKKKR